MVDASVVLKWQLDDEHDVDHALALRDDFLIAERLELDAPVLLAYELTNAIRSAAVRARLAPEMAEAALGNLLACGIGLHAPVPERILALALRFDISGYDAAYVAVAEELGAELWTADRRLHEATRGDLRWVNWIGNYAGSS